MSDKELDKELGEIRAQIDEVDARLLQLLNERAAHAMRIGERKRALGPNDSIYRPAREAGHLRDLVAANRGPLKDASVAALFREILSACRALEREIVVAFLGPHGTFTQEAVFKHFGRSVVARDFATIAEVFRAVEAGEPAYGVVPVENSSEGVVSHTLDCFMDSTLRIVGEIELPIRQHLLARGDSSDPGDSDGLGDSGDLRRVRVVYSHVQSFAQCRRWLEQNLAHCRQVGVGSNAEAAQRARDDANAAAIAGAGAGAEYGLAVLAEGIEDCAANATRFLVIGDHAVPPSGDDKTSVLVSAKNHPGSLAALLQILARRDVSLTRIESRPVRIVNWEYVFFLDVEGHCEERTLRAALSELEAHAGLYKLLGSYPCASA